MKSRNRNPVFVGSALLLTGSLLAVNQSGVPTVRAAMLHAGNSKAGAPPARPSGLMGTLASASGSSLKVTLVPAHRTVTIRLTTKTTYVVNGKPVKTHPAWKKGEQVLVNAGRAKNGTYVASSVMVGAASGGPGQGFGGPPPGGAPPVRATVVSSSKSTLVVKTAKGRTSYKLTSTTRYMVNGKPTTARPTFKAGQTVTVMASKSGGALIAQMVEIGAMPTPPGAAPPA